MTDPEPARAAAEGELGAAIHSTQSEPGAGEESAESRAPRGLAGASIVVLLVAVAAIVAPTIDRLVRPGPDEVYYLRYAERLAEQGPGALRALFQEYVADQQQWLFPNPLRVGYLAVAALWVGADGADVRSLSHLSLASHLLALVVAFRLMARTLGEARALLATVLLGVSPLWLGMARRALQDSFVALAAIVALSSFLAALERPENRRRLALFAAALAFAILAKESLVLLVPPMALWLAVEWRAGKLGDALPRFAAAIAAAIALCALVWTVAAGGFSPVQALVEIVVRSPSTNLYALRFGGGPWYRYLVDLISLSAWPTLLGVGGLALVIERARRGEAERFHLFLALVAVVTVAEYAFLTKNLRYVMLLELPLRVFAVEAIWILVPARATAARVVTAAALVALLAVADVRSFRYLFLERGLYDPMSAPILTLRGFVPER